MPQLQEHAVLIISPLGASSFPDHTRDNIPVISDGRFDPSTDEGDIGITRLRQQLLQAHGILMLIAWPVLAFTAIFFAVYMKQALPNGEWFQVRDSTAEGPA